MKYIVGDKVKIKSPDWYNKNKDVFGKILCGDSMMNSDKSLFCGRIVTISSVSSVTDTYKIKEDSEYWEWTDDMIEGYVYEIDEDTLKNIADNISISTSMKSEEIMRLLGVLLHPTMECPDGYIFKDENGNVIDAKKIVLEKKS